MSKQGPSSDAAAPAPPELSAADVRKVARLARLSIGGDEQAIERHRRELVSVLEHIGRISAIDVTGVEPQHRPLDASNRLDPDEPGPTIPREQILAAAPLAAAPFIAVPKVLADGS